MEKKLPIGKLFIFIIIFFALIIGGKIVFGAHFSEHRVIKPKSLSGISENVQSAAQTQTSQANTSTANHTVEINSTPTGYLNVRDGNSLSANIIGKVYPGQTYGYAQELAGWYQINLSAGETGWIYGAYATAQ